VRSGLSILVVAAAVLIAAGAAQATAPIATTGTVSSIGSFSAVVNGTVDPQGVATTWFVEYGTTDAYGSESSTHNAGNGTTSVDVSQQLTGLQAGRTYHYRLHANNADGPSVGADRTFTTGGGSAPVATTGGASLIGPFGGTVTGTIDPNGTATDWYVEYGTKTSYGSKTASTSAGSGSSAITVSVALLSLQSGATYNYRFVAVGGGSTSHGANRTFRTDPPPSVSTGSASEIRPTSAKLSGAVDPNRRPATAWFEYGTTSGLGTRTPEKSVGGGDNGVQISETVSGLPVGTTIYYRVVGRSGAGTTSGSTKNFKTSSGPTVVTGGSSSIGGTEATVGGSVNPNGRSTNWWFEWGTTSSLGTRGPVGSVGSGTTSVDVTTRLSGLPTTATIYFRLVAESSGGRVGGEIATFKTATPPVASTGDVTGLAIARATVNGRVDPVGATTNWWFEFGKTSALGSRSPGGSLQPGKIGRVSFKLTGLRAGTRYWFRLVAEGQGGRAEGRILSFATARVPRDPQGRLLRCTIVGSAGPDVLRGTSRRDVICGLGGDDRLFGLGGNDTIAGGDGADRIEGGRGDDRLFGGSGFDDVIGGDGHDHIDGGSGDDLLIARDGVRDTVVGGPGHDEGILDRADRVTSVERRRT
jgi:RTX calcium-binding nonapeptide repeat (4 copies)